MSKPLRLALFSDCAPQLLERLLPATLEVKTWAFTSPLAVQEELAAFQPDRVLIWATAEAGLFPEIVPLQALGYPLIVTNMVAMDDGVYGHLAVSHPQALRAKIEAWNTRLAALPGVDILDVAYIQAMLGRRNTFDARLWETAAIALKPEAVQMLAERLVALLDAQAGRLRKVLVTDLDGTLWKGILSEGEIQPDAPGFQAYQAWLKALSRRGILLAIASRNEMPTILTAFAHPAMQLTNDDFSFTAAGWNAKSKMLTTIAEHLHVHPNSLVFIDDSPDERAEVRAKLPEVTVPELPEDPTLRTPFLASLNLFETDTITEDDLLRAASLRANKARAVASSAPATEDYLASLEQVLTPEPLSPANIDRAAQLTQRCNQFNMRGTRHTVAELQGKRGWVYRLSDKFGDMGIVSAVILDGDFIETWVMSCRALNRNLEAQILAHLKAQGSIHGEYIPTERNTACAKLYDIYGIPHA